WKGWAILLRQKQKKLIMLPSETMIWQPEFTDKTLSRKPGAVQIVSQRILQFFEISDLRIVTKICVGAQINGDYCRLRAAFGKRTILYGCVIALGRYTVFGRPLGT
ncbi:hypothetical protein, partial [Escherichia coli]|uniref:hypothetical protein n=1 Tax=Escherichia coli TaxID=562 RepID=UPI001BFDB72C